MSTEERPTDRHVAENVTEITNRVQAELPLLAEHLRVWFEAHRTPAPQSKAPQLRVEVRFVPASDEFATAVREYEQIWAADGVRIVAAMERISGLSFVYEQFADTSITAIVLEKPSSSGFRDRSGMELRASYRLDTQRATLIHELGHRLMAGLYRRDEEEHGALFL